MTLVKVKEVPNGDTFTRTEIYSCDNCSELIHESFPHTTKDEKHYCWDCSYVEGRVSEEKYLSCIGIAIDGANASIRNGKVVVWIGKVAPWERTNKHERNTPKYKDWRKKVFERDNYTCQHCDQVGGELNAHHIKPFAKYKKLRYEVSNGLTLCVDCHRKVHKKRRFNFQKK